MNWNSNLKAVVAILLLVLSGSCVQPSGGPPKASPSVIQAAEGGIPQSPYNLNFNMPTYTPAQAQEVLTKYSYVDPTTIIPAALLQDALLYYAFNLSNVPNPGY